MAAAAAAQGGWISLQTPPEELLLANTLVTGQSFRWRRDVDSGGHFDTFTGVIGQRLVQVRQLATDVEYRIVARSPTGDPADDAAIVHDYFNLGTSLAQLSRQWAARDPRYALVAPGLPGCRMLRQDPVECLFQFICSSNNHISRIHGMVQRLCSRYGTPLLQEACGSIKESPEQQPQQESHWSSFESPAVMPGLSGPTLQEQVQGKQSSSCRSPVLPFQQQDLHPPLQQQLQQQAQQVMLQRRPQLYGPQQHMRQDQLFHAFPTLEQLTAATEDDLRADGFGYRAKYIVGSVQQLLDKPGGGVAWLNSLRDKSYAEAHEGLCSLPGVGPKVAACICLFSLDKHDAIPVDTHVWTLATRYYAPHLAKKSLTPKLHAQVQQAFVDRFGPYAGWAHNCLFISELASHKPLLQAGLGGASTVAAAAGAAAAAAAAAKAAVDSVCDGSQAESQQGPAPLSSKRRSSDLGLAGDAGGITATSDAAPGVVPCPWPEQQTACSADATGAVAAQESVAPARRRRRRLASQKERFPAAAVLASAASSACMDCDTC